MKKAAVASVIVLTAVAAVGMVSGKTEKIEASSVESVEKQGDEAAEEKDIKDPLIPEIDKNMEIEAGSRIAVVSKNTKGQFWEEMRKGMEDAVKVVNEAYGFSKEDAVTMTFEGPDDERMVETQINTLDAVISENPAVVCLSAGDMDSCQAQLEAARENGIPVVAFDSNVAETDLVNAFRGTDNQKAGEIAAEKLGNALKGNGKIIIFSAQEKTASIQERIEGFQKGLQGFDGIEIVEIVYQDEVEDMKAAIEAAFEKYPDLSGVYCNNGDIADIYLEVKKEKDPQVVMVGTDGTAKQQKAVKEGRQIGIVSQNSYAIGYQTLLSALALTKENGNVEKEVFLEPQWIDNTNIEDPQLGRYIY